MEQKIESQNLKKVFPAIKFIAYLMISLGGFGVLFWLTLAKSTFFYTGQEKGEMYLIFILYGSIILIISLLCLLSGFSFLKRKKYTGLFTIIWLSPVILLFIWPPTRSIIEFIYPLLISISLQTIIFLIFIFMPIGFLLYFLLLNRKKHSDHK
ncbi:MAG: hypothetical protein Athens101410_588 [Parcubacteria group bacterium Athens1014_10]|nr:MAG: hypothetical protein Athens101410_588 [Parcubacteria group bacterium Athens1014_10]TSD04649.1 MAG: hypothetical protein Athens071412_716 [Parcubacteria group bacterium Athens0714_12]